MTRVSDIFVMVVAFLCFCVVWGTLGDTIGEKNLQYYVAMLALTLFGIFSAIAGRLFL